MTPPHNPTSGRGRRAEEKGPVEVLSAYVHPCAGEHHLMLVDSDYERRTLRQLRHLQTWLGAKRGVALAIEKPVFDLGPAGDHDGSREGRDPCIPDLILRSAGAGAGGRGTVIVETMGYADEAYRLRKARMGSTRPHRRFAQGPAHAGAFHITEL
jgi:hypothetical protein